MQNIFFSKKSWIYLCYFLMKIKNIVTIEYSLKYYFKEEKIHFEEKCLICNKITIQSKKLDLNIFQKS